MSIKILLVEDEEDLVDIIQSELEYDLPNASLDVAMETLSIKEKLTQNQYNIILADLTVPGSAREPVLSIIESLAPLASVILFSGHVDLLKDNKHEQVVDFIAKPFRSTVLIEKIKAILPAEKKFA